jgi:hypothetical protein
MMRDGPSPSCPNTNLEKREREGKKGKKETDMLLKGMYEKIQRRGKGREKEPKRLTTPISLGRNRWDPYGVPPL